MPRGPYQPRSPLARQRVRRGLTLAAAAAALDVTREHLNRVELGQRVAGRRLVLAMAALYQLRTPDLRRMLSLAQHRAWLRARLAIDAIARHNSGIPRRR